MHINEKDNTDNPIVLPVIPGPLHLLQKIEAIYGKRKLVTKTILFLSLVMLISFIGGLISYFYAHKTANDLVKPVSDYFEIVNTQILYRNPPILSPICPELVF